mgnify:CR=1 FL=1
MGKSLDLTGQVYGRLTAAHVVRDKNGHRAWLCQCACGKETILATGNLRSGNTSSCGCAQGSAKFVNEVPGTRYGRLTIIRRGANKGTNATWLCRCDCGNEVVVRGQSLRDGNTTSCGCYRKDVATASVSLPYGVSGKNRAISVMKANARRRSLEWMLTEEEVVSYMQQNCHYCDIPPLHVSKGRNGSYAYNGLDRVDNNRGYVADNVVPCCIICNNAKRTLSLSEFLDWIRRVYTHKVIATSNKEA